MTISALQETMTLPPRWTATPIRPAGLRELHGVPKMPSLTSQNLPLISQALFGGGGLMVLAVFLRETAVWLDKRRRDLADKIDVAAERNKGDAALVEVARLQENSSRDRRAEEMAWNLAAERKLEVEGMKADQAAMRQEFKLEISGLKTSQTAEAEHRALVQVSANAAIDRANEALVKLEAANVRRDEIAAKLALVEQRATRAENRAEQLSREKSIEVESLRVQLRDANHNIEVLQAYIRDHKLTVILQQGEQIITASMDPPSDGPPATAPVPATPKTETETGAATR